MAEMTQDPAQMMTIEEVADYLQLHPLTVRQLAKKGLIPTFKVGRQWRAKRELLDQWIEAQSKQNLAATE